MPTCQPLELAAPTRSSENPDPEPNPQDDSPLEPAGIRGSLEEIRLSSILSILETERRTGILALSLPGGRKALLHLRKGRVLRAHLDGGEGPRHAELVYGLLADSRGMFDFRPSSVALGDHIRCTTARLLMEAVRRMDETQPAPSEPAPGRARALFLGLASAAGAVVGIGLFVMLGLRAVLCLNPSPTAASNVPSLNSTTP